MQTIKRRLSGMKLVYRIDAFKIKESLKSIGYQICICKQKTTNVTLFQAHLGRKPKTTLSNISTTPKLTKHYYEINLNHYLDAHTDPVENHLDDNRLVTGGTERHT